MVISSVKSLVDKKRVQYGHSHLYFFFSQTTENNVSVISIYTFIQPENNFSILYLLIYIINNLISSVCIRLDLQLLLLGVVFLLFLQTRYSPIFQIVHNVLSRFVWILMQPNLDVSVTMYKSNIQNQKAGKDEASL